MCLIIPNKVVIINRTIRNQITVPLKHDFIAHTPLNIPIDRNPKIANTATYLANFNNLNMYFLQSVEDDSKTPLNIKNSGT